MRQFFALVLLVLAAGLPLAAAGQSGLPAGQSAATVSLIDGWPSADGGRVAAVEIRLAPGWHTYWRVPGAAGIPPRFDWSASSNLASVAYEWPRPKLFDAYGLQTFGYDGALVLPVRLVPKDPAAPMEVRLSVEFGVCDEICVPASAEVSATLTGAGGGAEDRARIESALADRAIGPDQGAVANVTCTLLPAAHGFDIVAEVTYDAAPKAVPAAVLEAGQPDLWIGEAESRVDGRTLVATAPVEAADGGGPMLERKALRLTLIDPEKAIDIRGCAAPAR